MYCSECGTAATGKFCSHCGAKLASVPVVTSADWRNEVNYDVLMQYPDIKARIARCAENAKARMSGEAVLDVFDKLTKNPVPSKAIAGVLQPLYAKWGISTGKTIERVFPAPIGVIMVAGLCSLARNGQGVVAVNQFDDGCEITAKFPSDIFALEGSIIVAIRRNDLGTHVEAATKIPGQWIDWGKSTRALKRLFNEVENELSVDRQALCA